MKARGTFSRLEWVLLALILPFASCGTSGCAGQYSVGGGPIWANGMVGGSQNSGTGVGIETGYVHLRQSSAVGGILNIDYTGYEVGTDADPVLWAELDGLYRRFLIPPERALRPFVSGGIGGGGSIHNGVVAALFLEAGARLSAGRHAGLSLSLRERPAYFMTGGGPFGRFNNGVQLAVTLDLLVGRPD